MNKLYLKFSFLLTIFCFLISLNLRAQETAFTQSHLKAAQDMLMVMEVPEHMTGSINNILKVQTANLPLNQQKAFSDAMKAFLAKYLSWDLIKTDMAKIYAAEFSEAEIKELTTFYQTPLGKKMIEKSPILMQKGMLLGQQMVMTHQTELQEMIKATSPQH